VSIEAIGFDLGSVLVEYSITSLTESQNIANFLGVPLHDLDHTVQDMGARLAEGKLSEKDYWETLLQKYKIVIPECKYERFWSELFVRNTKANEEMFGLARDLRRLGYRTFLISDTIASHANYAKHRKWFDGFDPVLLSYEIGFLKESAEPFKIVCEIMKLRPMKCCFIDDQEVIIRAAEMIGMHGIVHEDYNKTKQVLRELLGVELV
jgi:putative hydrolase of the HAD superfamily